MANLIVRDFERHEISLPARVRVAGEHVSVVRLAAGAPSKDGWIETDLMDLSRTGFGLVSPVFLPRLSLVQVQIFDPADGNDAQPMVDGVVRVRRVLMTDGRPGYLLGTSTDPAHSMMNRQLEALVERCSTGIRIDAQAEGEDHA